MTETKISRAKSKTAVLLVNLGTPDEPTATACRRYLKEFLSDPRVVEIPRVIWWFVLNFIILRTRPAKSAETYAKIWMEGGSPLLVYSSQLTQSIAKQLGDDYHVELAMRYGKPSMATKLEGLKETAERLVVLPLYPQYAAATTASIFDRLVAIVSKWRRIPSIRFIDSYHDDPAWITSIASSIKAQQGMDSSHSDRLLLFSFHGLPERSRELGDPYYEQCLHSAELIAQELKLPAQSWRVVFQSRFGPAEWLKPYCVDTLEALPAEGITEVDIVCPGFAVDCLETLEEINITNREIFMQAGGKSYRYFEALNSSEQHAAMLTNLIRKQFS